MCIESLNDLGGVMTVGRITVYYFGNRVGFTTEIDKGIIAMAGENKHDMKRGLSDVEAKKAYFLREVHAAGVDMRFGTMAVAASIDGKAVVEKIALSGSSFDDFTKVKANVTLPAGNHILRMEATGAWFDIDYLNFVEGKDAKDPDVSAIKMQSVQYETPQLGDYYVFDMNGVRIGRMSAYTMDEAVETLKNTNAIKVQGVYLLRSVKDGTVKSVRIAR